MPRVYKTKVGSKKREAFNKERMKKAVYDVVKHGKSLRGTAKSYNLSVMTLKRYVKKKKEADSTGITSPSYESNYRQAQIFTDDEEKDLEIYLAEASKLYHGLTPKAVRELAYQFAVKNEKNISQAWRKNETATYEWLHSFMRRHTRLSLRVPEATSLSRATSFNKHNVSQFFEKLRNLYERFQYEPKDIWNVDETGITTVHKPKKIIACRGVKQVSKVTSAERGELVTVCSAINGSGNHIPPFMIFPRKNWQTRMIEGAPPGTDGAPHPSGWMTASNFIGFLQHFKKHVRCSKENQCLIIFDNHDSHISIETINYAKENGIQLLTIPPHTSHKLQPLDRTVFGALKSYYNTACDDWMLAHPGRPLSIYDIAGCLGKAYPSAMTPRNIVKSFEVTGISPFNRDIFTEDEFLSSYVTDRPEDPETDAEDIGVDNIQKTPDRVLSPSLLEPSSNDNTLKRLPASATTTAFNDQTASNMADPVTLDNNSGEGAPTSVNDPILTTSYVVHDSVESFPTSGTATIIPAPVSLGERTSLPGRILSPSLNQPITHKNYVSPRILKPHPKAAPRKAARKGRKRGFTRILTDTPEKTAIENETLEREAKTRKKAAKSVKVNLLKGKDKKQKKYNEESSSDEEVEPMPPSPESDFNISDSDEEMESDYEENDNNDKENIHEGDWVVVNFVSEKNVLHRFVGQIVNESLSSYDVKFAKKITDKKFKWPAKNDISLIAKYQVVKKVPAPCFKSSSKRVGAFEFPKSLRKFQIDK